MQGEKRLAHCACVHRLCAPLVCIVAGLRCLFTRYLMTVNARVPETCCAGELRPNRVVSRHWLITWSPHRVCCPTCTLGRPSVAPIALCAPQMASSRSCYETHKLGRLKRDLANETAHSRSKLLAKSTDDQELAEVKPPRHEIIRRRLKQSYGPTYLTVLSMIQGVALGDLASVVASGHQRFTLVQWALTLNTFGVLIIVWNVFNVQSALWIWIPDVRDGAVPFVVGALELYLNQAITMSQSTWLFALALIGITGAVGTWHIWWRSSHERENFELLDRLHGHIRMYACYLLVGSALALALAWTCATTGLDSAAGAPGLGGSVALGLACLTTASLFGSLYIFHLLWREAITYARGDRPVTSPPRTYAPDRLGQFRAFHNLRRRRPQATVYACMDARMIPGRKRYTRHEVH